MTNIFKIVSCVLILLFTGVLFVGCTDNTAPAPDNQYLKKTNELVIYSARKEKYVKPLVQKFEKETGIKVKLLAGDETLVSKVLLEKAKPYSDIFFSTDVGSLEYLRIKGALQEYAAPGAEQIFDKYNTTNNFWYALGARCRVLMYNKGLISEKDMPKTFWEVSDPKWKGQFMIPRGGNGSMIAHITALRTFWGDTKTKLWVKALANNAGAITKDHAEIRQAVGAGEYKFGIVNDNYYYQQLMEAKNNNVGIIYPDQGPNDMGVFVNVSGVGIIKDAPNMRNAKAFIDFMLRPDSLKLYSKVGSEIPVSSTVESPEFKGLLKLGEFKEMNVKFSEIGDAWYDVKKLMEEAGLDMNVK